jgi:hypothetical protein
MIVDHRTYTLATGRLGEFLAAYEAQGFPLYRRYCGRLVGYFTAETGEFNQVVHLWAYDSYEDRHRRRETLLRTPEWQSFLGRVAPYIVRQESRILRPTSFALDAMAPWWTEESDNAVPAARH